ncbi:NADP-dependent isocitrate dehydrogenase, partial [Corynebacterium bovis]
IFTPVAEQLEEAEDTITRELLDVQGSPADLGGYYWPVEEKVTAVMRPSATFTRIVDGLNANR